MMSHEESALQLTLKEYRISIGKKRTPITKKKEKTEKGIEYTRVKKVLAKIKRSGGVWSTRAVEGSSRG